MFFLIFPCKQEKSSSFLYSRVNYKQKEIVLSGLVKDILAAKFWIPLSRINYAAFLIHIDVLNVLFQNVETPVHYTSFTLVSDCTLIFFVKTSSSGAIVALKFTNRSNECFLTKITLKNYATMRILYTD
jgi:hypothetical protein